MKRTLVIGMIWAVLTFGAMAIAWTAVTSADSLVTEPDIKALSVDEVAALPTTSAPSRQAGGADEAPAAVDDPVPPTESLVPTTVSPSTAGADTATTLPARSGASPATTAAPNPTTASPSPPTTTQPVTTTAPPTTIATTTVPTTTTPTTVPATTTTTTTTVPATTSTTTATTTTTAAPKSFQTAWFHLVGGSVKVRYNSSEVWLDGTQPTLGFSVEVNARGPGKVEVEFEGSNHESKFTAEISNGRLVHRIEEEEEDDD